MTVFAHIDHAASAAAAGLSLDPTELLIFGDVQASTSLLQHAQTIGIDLPLKTLVFRSPSKITWLSYYDVVWVAQQHGIDQEVDVALSRLSIVIAALAKAATGST